MHDNTDCSKYSCVYPAEYSLLAEYLCDLHWRETMLPIWQSVARREYRLPLDYVIGIGVFQTPHADYPLRQLTRRWGNLVCSDNTCGRSWTGVDGEVCESCAIRASRSNFNE